MIEEYISIVEKLEENYPITNNRIVIEREYFKNLLEKYKFMKFRDKTHVYKTLNLIIHDKNNYTLPCKDTDLNKTIRKVVINYDTYNTLKHLYNYKVK